MKLIRKSIFTAASPNTQLDDMLLALNSLLAPWSWYQESENIKFKSLLKNYTGVNDIFFVDSGRSALYVILKSINIEKDDEVIMPSFTCVVVANAVKWSGANPIYLDTKENDFNANYDKVFEKITKKTKAIVVQHTFGKKVDVTGLKNGLNAIDRSDIVIIEDFAHIIKSPIDLKGNFGFTTFGIEKVISSVRGGAILTNSLKYVENIDKKIDSLPKMPRSRVLISILNPIFWYFAIPLHSIGFGRFSLGALIRNLWRRLGFLGIMVEDSENKAEKPNWFPAKMPGVLSSLGTNQLEKLSMFNEHRSEIAHIYHSKLSKISDSDFFDAERVYLRYPILLKNENELKKVWDKARDLRVTLGNWFSIPLYGASVNKDTYKKLCYVPKQTPVTKDKCKRVLNLPTSVNMSKARAEELAEEIVKIIDKS